MQEKKRAISSLGSLKGMVRRDHKKPCCSKINQNHWFSQIFTSKGPTDHTIESTATQSLKIGNNHRKACSILIKKLSQKFSAYWPPFQDSNICWICQCTLIYCVMQNHKNHNTFNKYAKYILNRCFVYYKSSPA